GVRLEMAGEIVVRERHRRKREYVQRHDDIQRARQPGAAGPHARIIAPYKTVPGRTIPEVPPVACGGNHSGNLRHAACPCPFDPVAMLPEIPAWLGVLVAPVPPALKWWWGRGLARRLDDPLLPERRQAQARRTGAAFMIVAVLIAIVSPSWALLAITLMTVLHLAAGYPLRRALYQETWSLAAY